MDEFHQGAMGTTAGLGLRLVQAICAASALLFMFSGDGFRRYTSFCFLVIVMGLVIPWSLMLAMVDYFFVFIGVSIRQRPWIIFMVIVIDWIFAFLSLAASCSIAASTNLLFPDVNSCNRVSCSRYYFAGIVGFLCYILLLGGSLSNIFILPS